MFGVHFGKKNDDSETKKSIGYMYVNLPGKGLSDKLIWNLFTRDKMPFAITKTYIAWDKPGVPSGLCFQIEGSKMAMAYFDNALPFTNSEGKVYAMATLLEKPNRYLHLKEV